MKKILLLSFLLAIPYVVFSFQDGEILINHNTFKGNLTNAGQSFTATKTTKWTALSFEFQVASTGTLKIYAGHTGSGTPIHTQPFNVGAGEQEIVLTTPIDIVQGQQYTAITDVTCAYYPFATYAGGSAWTVALEFPGDLWMKVTTLDKTPPVFENSTPSSANIATTSFTLNTDIDEAGTIYYVVLADGATAPTSAEVKAGIGSGGSGQIKSGNAAVTTGGFTNAFNVTGLTLNTAYDVYVVAEDDEGTPNIQATPTKVDVTTLGGGFIVVESGGSTSTNENGTTDTFTVALNSQPNSNVVINLSSGDVTEGTIDKSTLTFTTANWNVAQTVTVTGLDDAITDGSPSYNVTLSIDAALTDDAFDGAANKTVSVTNFDNEITAASAGADQNVCGTSTFLGGNSPNGGESGTWSIISGTGGSFGGVNSPTSSFSGTINTAYTLRWMIDNGGVSESTDDVVITLLDNPTVAAAGPDQNNIAGTATLAGNAVSGLNTTGTWTQVAGPGVVSFGDANSPTSTATVNLVGSYTFRWTSSNSTCPISSDDVVIAYTSIAPTVTNSAATSITGNGAMVSGNVTSDGNNTITERGFVYALTSNDATPTVAEVNGTTVIKIVSTGTTGNYNTTLTGLVGNREYAYVAFATNGAGTTESTIQTFTTINTSPTFTSTAVTTANENDTYTYTITTNDADGDAVVVTAPTKPSWLALDTNVTVSTLAGDGTAGFLNATGTAAKFNRPYGVAVDASGNVYIADLFNHQIRKISPTGIVTTLAGSTVGFANGTGATAQFNDPRGIAIDGSGNVYVADNQNHRIRKITPAGVVTTLAGSSQGYTDDIGTAAQFHSPTEVAVDKSGNVYVADNGNHRIRKITAAGVVTTLAGSGVAGFAEGTGIAAQFNQPFGITVDGAGNVYVADRLNHRIRKITSAGVVTTLAGSTLGFADGTGTAAQFSSPFGLDIDSFGNIYVADFNNKRIRKVSPAGVVTTVAGTGSSGLVNGVGSIAQFNFPAGVSVDASNNVYVADYSNNSVRKIEQKQVLTGTPTSTDVGNHNVVLEANDGNGGTVQQSFTISVNTKPTVSSSTATAIKATKATLNGNVSSGGGTAITERGFVYALSSDDSTPTVAEVNGTTVIKVVVSGTTGAFNKAITGLTVSGTYSFAAYAINSVGTTESSVATFTTINTPPTFTSSAITAVDEGDTYIYTITTNDVDADNLTITAPTKPSWLNLTTAPGGDVTTVAGTGSAGSTDGNGSAASFYSPTGVAVDGSGNVYVADAFNHRIRKIAPNGDVTTIAGSGIIGSMDGNGTSASFNSPWGIAVDDSGNVYVADTGNHSIRKITPNGDVTTFAGSGSLGNTDGNGTSASFKSPTGLAIDGSGNFYVVDAFNHNIRKITPNGDVTTIAGSGSPGNTDGNGTAANFSSPWGIAVDGSGNVYVADTGNNNIRKITPNGDATTLAGSGTAGNTDGNGTSASFNFPYGVAVDGSGNLYVSDGSNRKIRKIAPNGDVTTIAGTGSIGSTDANGTAASFYVPYGVALDGSENLYVTDQSNNKIRKISLPFATLTGNSTGQAGDHPVVLEANDGNGGTAQQSFTISVNTKPTVSSSAATSITGTRATLNGNVSSDGGAAITERGFVYALSSDDSTPTVAEVNGTTVLKVVVSGTTGAFNKAITELTVNGTYSFAAYAINSVGTTESSVATFTAVNTPPTFTSTAITTVDEGDTYTYTITTNDADGDNVTLTAPTKPSWLSLTTNLGGDVTTFAGSGSAGNTDGNATSASFNAPFGVAVNGSGNVYVADTSNHTIRKITLNGDVTTFAGSGSAGNTDGNGSAASFNFPFGIAVDDSGNVYVTEQGNHKIRKITPNGDVTTVAGTGSKGNTDGNGSAASFDTPAGIAVDASGNMFVADQNNHTIRKIAPNGDVTTIAGSGSTGNTNGNGTAASFRFPRGIAIDASGNVFVADQGNHTIRKIAPNGDVTTVAGTGSSGNMDGNSTSASFNNPIGVAVDDSGNIYVVDIANHKIRKIAPNGDVTTVAGTGSAGNTDGNGTSASFNTPVGIVVDSFGNLYIADLSNHKIRKISAVTTLTGDSTGQAGDYPVVLEANDGNGGTVQQSFTINVLPEPTVTLSVDNSSINEATGTATLTATLSNAFGKNVEVTIGYSGTALNGTDYNSTASTTITITAGQTSASAAVIITPINDTSPEGNETIIAEITGVTNGTEKGNQTLEITLVDDDLIPAVITFADINKTYGDADFALGATSNSTGTISYSIVAGGTGSASLSGTNNGTLNVGNAGTVTIRATLPADGIYGAAKKDITLTIAKAVLVVTANNQTITYGDSFSIGFTYGPFKNGDDASVLDTGAFVFFVDPITSFDAGTYTIRAGAVNDNNYTASYVDGTFTISKATLTATADDKSKEYGDANPAFTISYSGFKGADTISDIDTAPTASSTATTTTDVGTVAITIAGGNDNNYTIAPVNGTLSIGKATLTATADDKSKEYGEANPTFTISYSGFKGADTISDIDTAPTASSTATTTTDVGTVAITTTGGADNNYTITPVNGTLTIGKATLTATADDKTKVFGQANPTFTITYSGFKGADTASDIDTAPVASSTATTNTPAGTVPIELSAATDGNYTIVTVNGTLTILGDNDGDGIPDITDPDDDNDGVPDVDDNSYLPNPDQEDSNNNGIGDVQEDCDNDGILNYYDTENEGCQASIVMKKKYGFSPNGDGVNDTWVIENIALYPNNVVNIYNRSGKLVFSMKGYDNSFNGFSNKTSSSNKLPVGAYYFTVEFNTPGAKPAKGWIYINY